MTHHLSGLGAEMEKCIQECLNCYSVCLSQVLECLKKGGKHSEPKHMRLMMDCVEICKVSADFMLRNSLFHTKTCDTCAEVCVRWTPLSRQKMVFVKVEKYTLRVMNTVRVFSRQMSTGVKLVRGLVPKSLVKTLVIVETKVVSQA
jgi:hypothetical protein